MELFEVRSISKSLLFGSYGSIFYKSNAFQDYRPTNTVKTLKVCIN